jgi:predicted HTH transcriptional regulator
MLNEHIANLEREMEEYKRQTGGQKTAEVDRKGGQKTREALLQMIAADPSVTTTQMASALGINRSAVSKHLDRLKADGRLRRVGPYKGGHWELLM